HARPAAVEFGRHQAVGRGAGGALGHVLGALEPEQLDRGLQVAARLLEGVLAVHHAGAGLLTQPLHVGGGEIRHVLVSHSVSLAGFASSAASARPSRSSASSEAASSSLVSADSAVISRSAAPSATAASTSAVSGGVTGAVGPSVAVAAGAGASAAV